MLPTTFSFATVQEPEYTDPATALDVLNGTAAYSCKQRYDNRTVYTEDAKHSLSTNDTITFYANPHKPSGNFRGVYRPEQRISRDVPVLDVLGNTIYVPIVTKIVWSIPVGVNVTEIERNMDLAYYLMADKTDIRAKHLVKMEI
jgi:hypothetical protein